MKHLVLDYYDEVGIPGYIEVEQVNELPEGIWQSDRVSIIVVDDIIKMYYTCKQTPDALDREWAEWILTGRYLTPFNEQMQTVIQEVNEDWKDIFPRLDSISESDSPILLDFIWDRYRSRYIDKE